MNYFSTVAVINSHREVLTLFHLKSQSWRLVGGKIESGESADACAARELEEEVGIKSLRPLRYLGRDFVIFDGNPWVGYYYTLSAWNGEVSNVEPDKHSQLCWRPLSQIACLHETDQDILALAQFTPVQERILRVIGEAGRRDNVNDEQLAARVGVSYRTFTNNVYKIRRIVGMNDHKRHRVELGEWWRKFGRE